MTHRFAKAAKFIAVGLAAGACLALARPQRTEAVPPRQRRQLLVAAAASLKNVMGKLGRSYHARHADIDIRFNFASSGTLQQQIEHGAPVDIYAPAADENMDALQQQDLIYTASRIVMARNTLVLIVPAGSHAAIYHFGDLTAAAVRYVAIGGPYVPAGIRAQEVFGKLGIWPQIAKKAVRGKDVREVLTQVKLGNVDAGVVYATDAASTSAVRVVATAPANMHKPIRYPVAVVRATRNSTAAQSFVKYLSGAEAQRTLRRAGFLIG